jgi:hypothetical protein
MTGGQMMIVLIVAMVMIASIVKSKQGHGRKRDRAGFEPGSTIESPDTRSCGTRSSN